MKTNALFKAFLSLSLLSGVLQLYFTNYMSVANTEYSAHVAESNAVPYARNDATCYGVQTSTIRCPLGENTPAEYHQSMNLTYDNARNTDQFRICSNLPLPFTESSPIECWPRLIILPSHTTSGSKLFRGIWELFGVQMSQFKEEPNVDKLFSIQSLDVFGRLDTTTAIPFMQQPLIFKSHISQENSEKRREMKESLHIAKSNGVLRGIVRIARNPGDQLMRNKVRWGKSAKRRKRANNKGTFDQFLVKSTKYCEEIAQEGTYRVYFLLRREKIQQSNWLIHSSLSLKVKITRSIYFMSFGITLILLYQKRRFIMKG